MTVDVVATTIAGIAILVGCIGIVVPVLPGSILIGLAALGWAIAIGGTTGWVTFAVIAVLVSIGMTASWVLTGRRLKAKQVPNSSLLVGGVLAVIGFFVVPIIGLLLGFVAGLYLAEYLRLKDYRTAWDSSWTAIKAAGIGIIIEFSAAAVAAGAFVVGNVVHYLNV
ncbi:DUF456 domain-containing protein [Brevibacterium daeguense]|uniref:DUF456 domain-containing protein n=1 Tax=Brevibacterium daeguense TaxID=909936 RepID=A0ABP8EGJ2_9MICO|nr:DUF456 domain-containing protein [Brevibacterium daeguense]